MNDIDTRLRESLDHHIAAVPTPPVDIRALEGRGRRARLRRAAGAGALTTGVIAAAVSLALVLPNSVEKGRSPFAAGPEPVAGPTGLFVTESQVFLGGKVYDVKLPWDTGAHVGANGVAYSDPRSGRPMLLGLDGVARPLAQSPQLAGAKFDDWVAADSDSGLVSWAEYTKTTVDIVAFDTGSMSEVARTNLPCDMQQEFITGCPRPYVASSGEVFIFVSGGGARVWDPATGELTGRLPDPIAQAHNGVLTGFEGARVSLDELGPGWEQATVPEGFEAILSYDGGWLLDNGGRPRVVNWRNPEQTIRYSPQGTVEAATFDTDGSVLVVTHDKGQYAGWDCALGGECTQVVSPRAEEIRLVAWDL